MCHGKGIGERDVVKDTKMTKCSMSAAEREKTFQDDEVRYDYNDLPVNDTRNKENVLFVQLREVFAT